MIILCFIFIPIFYIIIKLILYFIVCKLGKFSYDGFSIAGFNYNSKKDVFYSTKNAWQKKFGYSHMYDVGAPIFRMIIDTEPIRFYYNNKNWLITFWKGQYGIVTGAEIGIYCTTEQRVNKKTIYLPANDNEMLNMSFVLLKNKNIIAKTAGKHWWLTVFKLGMFSKPKELVMDINMTFPNKQMLNAFLTSFKKLGYKDKDYKVIDNTFCFIFKKPKTHKVWTRNWLMDSIRQSFNHKNVNLYNKYLSDVIETNGIDDSKTNNKDLIMLKDLVPDVLKTPPLPSSHNPEPKVKKVADNDIYLNENIYKPMGNHDKKIK